MEPRPQWSYFMMERKFFEDTLFVEEGIRNTPSWQTCVYRNLLFAFAKLRKHVKFNFKFSETDDKCEVDFSFDTKDHERSFFYTVYFNKCDENDYKTIQFLLSNYFFEFVSDLSSISQKHGYNLFPYIFPPAFVRNYYNILIVSKIIVDEFDRLERNNSQDKFVRDVINFISKRTQGFSEQTLDFVCNNLSKGSKVPYKTFKDGLDKQIRSNDDSYVKEIKYLLRRHKICGPYFLDYKPVSFDMCGQDGNVIPRYLRIANQVEDPRIKYVQFAHYLQAWKGLDVDYLDNEEISLSRHTLNGQDIIENPNIDFQLIDGMKVDCEPADDSINVSQSPRKEESEQKPVKKSPPKIFTKSNRRVIKIDRCCSGHC